MSITGDVDGQHLSHCCGRHGCKYGDADCPVANGAAQQEYPCEWCVTPEDAQEQVRLALDEYTWSCMLFGRLFPARVLSFMSEESV